MSKRPGIIERSKDDIEERQIRIITSVNVARMVNGVTLRALNDIPKPSWSIDIRMLKYAQKISN